MNNSRRTLLVIFLLFLTPVLIAVVLHKFPSLVNLTGQKNYGELIQPAMPLDDMRFITPAFDTVDKTFFEGHWTFLIFSSDACGSACEEQLYKTRQTRLALGKDMDKAQRLLILPRHSAPPVNLNKELDHDLLLAVPADDAEWQTMLLAAMATTTISNNESIDQIYLIDPLGNLMMAYPNDIAGNLILKDLQRLVRVSWIQPK
jgi:hypothetical protein